MNVAAALGLFALAQSAAANGGHELRFIGCPIYRDTDQGAKSGCWLVDDPASGERYDVSRAPSKPDWNHAVLVEARVSSEGANVCGGRPLNPVRVSVIDAPCTRFMLEAEGYTGRKFTLPKRNVRPLYEDRAKPGKPFARRTVVIPFDFDRLFIVYQLGDYYLDQAINYALDVQPARVTVIGYAASRPAEVSGHLIAEPAALAGERAALVARALTLRGVPRDRITVSTGAPSTNADEAFDGLAAPSERRVEIRIDPMDAKQGARP